jgi:endoglucanase
VSGRKRPAGEMNGKSGNINNCCSQIYPKGTKIPTNEIVCIFDADQVPTDDARSAQGFGHLTCANVCSR